MKTIRQHLESLPEPYGEMALESVVKDRIIYLDSSKTETLTDALSGIFIWRRTEMGYEFWQAIYLNLLHLKK